MAGVGALLQAKKGVVLLDGGMSTALEELGADLRCDLWTAKYLHEHPEQIVEAHKRFYTAGADVVITSSYQTSIDLLMRECNFG